MNSSRNYGHSAVRKFFNTKTARSNLAFSTLTKKKELLFSRTQSENSSRERQSGPFCKKWKIHENCEYKTNPILPTVSKIYSQKFVFFVVENRRKKKLLKQNIIFQTISNADRIEHGRTMVRSRLHVIPMSNSIAHILFFVRCPELTIFTSCARLAWLGLVLVGLVHTDRFVFDFTKTVYRFS